MRNGTSGWVAETWIPLAGVHTANACDDVRGERVTEEVVLKVNRTARQIRIKAGGILMSRA